MVLSRPRKQKPPTRRSRASVVPVEPSDRSTRLTVMSDNLPRPPRIPTIKVPDTSALARSMQEKHQREERQRVEGVEREEALIELTAQNAERIGELITVVAAQAELAAEQRDLAADQRDLAAEQHEENRRLSLLTNVVSLAVILQVLLMVFEPEQVWTKIAVVASALGLAVLLAWAGRRWSTRRSKRKD